MVTFNEQLIINTNQYLNTRPSFFDNKLSESAQFLKDHFYDNSEGKLYIIELVRRIGIRIQFDHEINLKEMDSSYRVSRNMPYYQDELAKVLTKLYTVSGCTVTRDNRTMIGPWHDIIFLTFNKTVNSNYSITLKSHSPQTMPSIFNVMRQTGELTDYTIKLSHGSLQVHRLVLAANSIFFRTLFQQNNVRESIHQTLDLSHVPHELVKAFINFIYTNELTLINPTINDLIGLVKLANLYQIEELISIGVDTIIDAMTEENVSDIMELAQGLKDEKLKTACRVFLLDRVTEENASVVLSLADTFKDEKLKRRCELKLNIIN